MTSSAWLLQQDKYDSALKLLGESIAEAIREQQHSRVRTLCHHAAVASSFLGDSRRGKYCYEQSLQSVPENPRALYGLAKVASEQGEQETATLRARRCYKAIMSDKDVINQSLLELLLLRWPDVATD